MKRGFTIALGLVLVVGVSVVIRVYLEARAEFDAALAAQQAGDETAARTHYLCAARWYLPFDSTSRRAVAALLDQGDAFLNKGDPMEALFSFDDARGALYATAWLVGPDPALLARANAGYAKSLAQWKEKLDSTVDKEEERLRYLGLASQVHVPNRWWMLVMGVTFIGWIAALATAAWRWDVLGSRRLVPLAISAACLALWVVSLTQI